MAEEDDAPDPTLEDLEENVPQQYTVSVMCERPSARVPRTEPSPHEVALMAMVCYGCGKHIIQVDIEEELKKGTTLRDTLDKLKYVRMCCRTQILEEPVVVRLLKQQTKR